MIKASNLILSIRQKLNDKDTNRYKFTSPEVVDAINLALIDISEDLLFFNRIWKIKCNKEKVRYSLPSDFLRLISVRLNDRKIENIKSLEAYESIDGNYTKPVAIIDNISIRVYDLKDDDELEIEYNYIEHIDDENSQFEASLLLYEPIVLYATAQLYQNPVFKDGLQKSAFYQNLYERKMGSVRSRIKSSSNSKNIIIKYRKV